MRFGVTVGECLESMLKWTPQYRFMGTSLPERNYSGKRKELARRLEVTDTAVREQSHASKAAWAELTQLRDCPSLTESTLVYRQFGLHETIS